MTRRASDWRCEVDRRFGLGESPFWHAAEDRLYWLDIAARQAWRMHMPSSRLEHWDLPETPGCFAPTRNGGFVVALRDGVFRAHAWGAPLQKLAAAPYDTQRLRFNDGKCDPWGRFWAGTYVEAKDRPDGALYCMTLHGTRAALHEVARGVMSANGLAWAPDGRSLYWADTAAHCVRRYPITGSAREPALGAPVTFALFDPKPAGWDADAQQGRGYGGRPDGAAVDSLGRYWVAMYEGARVLCLSPQGQVLADYPTPAQCPTMVCFGEQDRKTLYLTTASAHRSAAELQRLPQSGAVFSLRVDTPGLPTSFFEDT